jgi:translation initiation factor eIF-2B subunit epsilon
LLADVYTNRMVPVTYSVPHALIPVANVPLIEYALELLVSAGVNQVFIVVSEHTDALQQYIDKAEACKQFTEVQVLVAPGCKTVGQAMREVDSRDKIRSDFIFCNVDTIAHLNLLPALAAHKRRREEEKNKDAIVTLLLVPSPPVQRRPIYPEEDVIVAINPETNRLVHYQSLQSKELCMDIIGPDNVHRFEAHSKIQFRYDVEWSGICVCSPEALCLFTDEFDWQDWHKDFIPGVLQSEILSYQIFTQFVKEGYCSRVGALNKYAQVTMHILRQRTH